jgi:plastocyanin
VVHRALNRLGLGVAVGALAVTVALVGAASADAANRRVAIGHYQWSLPQIRLDLGEHVTWYWVGPDTLHSVTGTSPNDAGWDSDPGASTPRHDLGDTYQLTFNQPGTYTFQCKLHSSVRGSVIVSNEPGDPNTEVDPVPKLNVDVRPPHLNEVKLSSRKFGRHGTTLRWGVNERSKLDAEYYEVRNGHRGKFAGWHIWRAHVGYNDVSFGGRSKHFRATPGRYMAVIRATDTSNNTGGKKIRRFRIR